MGQQTASRGNLQGGFLFYRFKVNASAKTPIIKPATERRILSNSTFVISSPPPLLYAVAEASTRRTLPAYDVRIPQNPQNGKLGFRALHGRMQKTAEHERKKRTALSYPLDEYVKHALRAPRLNRRMLRILL